jgi:hypothetical protein
LILCVGLAADNTFCHSLAALKRAGASFTAIDFAQLAYSGQVSFYPNDFETSTISLHGSNYVLSSYEAAWIRFIDIAEGAPTERLQRTATGLYQVLCRMFTNSPLRVMNPPMQDSSNFSKLYHEAELATARSWCIPRSCLTNSTSRALEFIASCCERVIFKGASAAKTWATLYDPTRDLERMRWLSVCPVLFQERIEGPDCRVHVVGERIFAEVIESGSLDYRNSNANVYRPLVLPNDIAESCLSLAHNCGIPFLGIDFKIQQTSGTWFFLEANPLPQYEPYDRRAGGAISQAIVEWLVG